MDIVSRLSSNWGLSPVSGPESCCMFIVFTMRIKVSIILKMIQWNYQLTKQNWLVCGRGTVLLFNKFWLQNLPSGPKSFQALREMGPWSLIKLTCPVKMTSKPKICPNKWSSWPQHGPLTGHYFERWRPRRFFNLNPCRRVLRYQASDKPEPDY